MHGNERKNIIKKLLLDKGTVSVNELGDMLNVSEVTIRRDLEKLEKEKFLIRSHGGATINKEGQDLNSFNFFENSIDSDEIAETALREIEDNDIIFLGSGDTNYLIAKKLKSNMMITVLTNNLMVALETTKKSIETILLGGNVDKNSFSVYGDIGERILNEFYVRKAFIEADSINLSHGIFINNNKEMSILKKILEIAETKIITCKAEKFGKNSFVRLCNINNIDKVATSSEVSNEVKKFFYNNRIPLLISYIK